MSATRPARDPGPVAEATNLTQTGASTTRGGPGWLPGHRPGPAGAVADSGRREGAV